MRFNTCLVVVVCILTYGIWSPGTATADDGVKSTETRYRVDVLQTSGSAGSGRASQGGLWAVVVLDWREDEEGVEIGIRALEATPAESLHVEEEEAQKMTFVSETQGAGKGAPEVRANGNRTRKARVMESLLNEDVMSLLGVRLPDDVEIERGGAWEQEFSEPRVDLLGNRKDPTTIERTITNVAANGRGGELVTIRSKVHHAQNPEDFKEIIQKVTGDEEIDPARIVPSRFKRWSEEIQYDTTAGRVVAAGTTEIYVEYGAGERADDIAKSRQRTVRIQEIPTAGQ